MKIEKVNSNLSENVFFAKTPIVNMFGYVPRKFMPKKTNLALNTRLVPSSL